MDDTERKRLIEAGKELGITQASNMGVEKLKLRIIQERAKSEDSTPDSIYPTIQIDEKGDETLEKLGVKKEWLYSIANQYSFDKFEFIQKFLAFRCYRGSKHVEWIDVNILSLFNGNGEVTKIPLKHTPLSEAKQIITFKWRL